MRFVGLCALAATACGPAVVTNPGKASSQGTSVSGPTTVNTPTSQGTTDSELPDPGPPGSTTAAKDPISFIEHSDIPSPYECSLDEQDCLRGFKCMPLWDATACFPAHPNPVGLGELCEHELREDGGWSGTDNCGVGAVCWDYNPKGPGICKGLCGWPSPQCKDPDATPYAGCGSCFCICEYSCNPLLSECLQGDMCVLFDDLATCVPDASGDGGSNGDACGSINECDPGLGCLSAEAVPGCNDSWGCCTPYCDTQDPDCPIGTVCDRLYPKGRAPPDLENVGMCLAA